MHDLAILAGGDGRRIGGGKPAALLAGRPLIAWVVAALAPAATRVGIVARSRGAADALAALAAPWAPGPVEAWVDAAGAEGPVAALLGAAAAASAPRLLTAPVDTPFLPPDLAARLGAPNAVAVDDGPNARLHPTVALYDRTSLAALPPQRSLRATIAPLAPCVVPLPEKCLFNINTADDLAAAEAMLRADPLTPHIPSR